MYELGLKSCVKYYAFTIRKNINIECSFTCRRYFGFVLQNLHPKIQNIYASNLKAQKPDLLD